MIYKVRFSMDNSKYFKVSDIKKVEETSESMYDLGTEALFVDVNNHSKIVDRINCNACSDIKTVCDAAGELETYMQFEKELPEKMIEAVKNEELFFSEC